MQPFKFTHQTKLVSRACFLEVLEFLPLTKNKLNCTVALLNLRLGLGFYTEYIDKGIQFEGRISKPKITMIDVTLCDRNEQYDISSAMIINQIKYHLDDGNVVALVGNGYANRGTQPLELKKGEYIKAIETRAGASLD